MGGWKIESEQSSSSVHNNSGEITCSNSLCSMIPSHCAGYANESIRIYIEEDTLNFDRFTDLGKISKNHNLISCNREMLVMWFYNESGNTSYSSILKDNSIVDIKNIDECRHVVINNLKIGGQKFDTSAYTDSGYPAIYMNPCDSDRILRYESGGTVQGHKIKYRVTSDTIPSTWFDANEELVELYFPHMSSPYIKTIGSGAFSGCTNLSAVTFSAVQTIEEKAFYNCGIERVDWRHKNCCSSYAKTIGASAFCNNKFDTLCLDKLISIQTIGESAFKNCESASTLTLPSTSSYTIITNSCFENVGVSSNNIQELVIPNYIKHIGENAFKNLGIGNSFKLDIGTGITNLSSDTAATSSIGNDAFNFYGTFKVRIQNVTDYDNIIANLPRIFEQPEGNISFYIGDSTLASRLNAYYGSGEDNKWKFFPKSSWPNT